MQLDVRSDDVAANIDNDERIKSTTLRSDPNHEAVPPLPVTSDGERPATEVSSLLHGPKEPVTRPRRIPLFAWPLLVVSLASVSSAGVVFASLPDVPTFTLAAWRLQTTGLLLVPGATYQYITVPPGMPTAAGYRLHIYSQA